MSFDIDNEKSKESVTLYALPIFKRSFQVNIYNKYMYCSCKFRNRYGIDYPYVYHTVSQTEHFNEPNHHDISMKWWDSFYQLDCMSKNDKQFEPLEKTMKILQPNEKEDFLFSESLN